MTAKAAKSSTKKAKSKPKAVSAAAKTKTPDKKPASSPKSSLRAWNLRFGIVLLALAIAVVVVGNATTVPVSTQYLAKDVLASDAAGQTVLATATRHLWDVHVSWLVAKFLAIFGIVFLLAATALRSRYEAWLDRGVNGLRWLGLGVGGGSVLVTVTMLSGVSDMATLSLTFVSVVLASILAAAVELLGSARKLRRLLAWGALAGIVFPWLLLVRTVGGVMKYNGDLPTYLYYLYASVTLLVVAVILATYMRVKQRGKWADTFYTERMFMTVAFIAAAIPALQIFAGALQP